VKVDHAIWDSKGCDKNATSTMMEISSRSQPNSPTKSPLGSPPNGASLLHIRQAQRGSVASQEMPSRTPSVGSGAMASIPPSVDSSGRSSSLPIIAEGTKQDTVADTMSGLSTPSSANSESRQSVVSIGSAAAAAAKKWGWSVLNRGEQASKGGVNSVMPNHPIGRGRPLPPPGTPLPPPEKFNFKSNPISIPKRKPLPPPLLRERHPKKEIRADPKASLADRTNIPQEEGEVNEDRIQDDILVIKAPSGSDPASPVLEDPNSAERMPLHQSGRESAYRWNSISGPAEIDLVPEDGSDRLSASAESEADLSSWPAAEGGEARQEFPAAMAGV